MATITVMEEDGRNFLNEARDGAAHEAFTQKHGILVQKLLAIGTQRQLLVAVVIISLEQ